MTVSQAASTALATSLLVKATPGQVYKLLIYNDKASAQYVQVHDKAAAPADTTVPLLVFEIATKATKEITFDVPIKCAVGIYLCNSSTANTKTIGSADCWFFCQYL